MRRLPITPDLLWVQVHRVAPEVELLTGWPLRLNSLQVFVVSRRDAAEFAFAEMLRSARLPPSTVRADEPLGWLRRAARGRAIGAFYEHGRNAICAVSDNVDESNNDGLALILAHELAHRAQHLQYQRIHAKVQAATRRLYRLAGKPSTTEEEWRAVTDEITPIMTVMESHATYVTELARRTRLPLGRTEPVPWLARRLDELLDRDKCAQYRETRLIARAVGMGELGDLFTLALQGQPVAALKRRFGV
jgi:hypothetical protein